MVLADMSAMAVVEGGPLSCFEVISEKSGVAGGEAS